MATATIYTTVDAFNNNISGFYDSETFVIASTTSSSNGTENDALFKFTTVGAGIGANDTINSVTLWTYKSSWSDPLEVNQLSVYTDINNVWGTLGAEDPPMSSISFGTVSESTMSSALGWVAKPITTSIPKSGIFNVGISCDASDTGAGEAVFDSIENTSGREAYIVIDYTPQANVTITPSVITTTVSQPTLSVNAQSNIILTPSVQTVTVVPNNLSVSTTQDAVIPLNVVTIQANLLSLSVLTEQVSPGIIERDRSGGGPSLTTLGRKKYKKLKKSYHIDGLKRFQRNAKYSLIALKLIKINTSQSIVASKKLRFSINSMVLGTVVFHLDAVYISIGVKSYITSLDFNISSKVSRFIDKDFTFIGNNLQLQNFTMNLVGDKKFRLYDFYSFSGRKSNSIKSDFHIGGKRDITPILIALSPIKFKHKGN